MSKDAKENKDECKEYNSLKYRTLISTGANIDTFPDATEETLNKFLNMDIENNKKAVWSKLSKTEKLKKIKKYVKETLVSKHNLNEDECSTAIRFFTLMIDRKKLSKNNELSYNQENGNIDQIGGLLFNTDTRKFNIVLEQPQSKKKTKKII
jgi:hypothetical protein